MLTEGSWRCGNLAKKISKKQQTSSQLQPTLYAFFTPAIKTMFIRYEIWNLKFAFLWPDPFFFFFWETRPFQCVYMFYMLRNGSSQLGERVPGILQTEILLHICYCILHTSSLWNHVLKTQFQPTWQCVWYYDECAMASVW